MYYIVLPGVCALYCTTRCLLCTTDVLFLFYLDIIHWSWYIHSRGFIYIHSLTIGSTHPLYTTPTLLATLFIDKHHYMYKLYILFADFPDFNLRIFENFLCCLYCTWTNLSWLGDLYISFYLKNLLKLAWYNIATMYGGLWHTSYIHTSVMVRAQFFLSPDQQNLSEGTVLVFVNSSISICR